MPHMPTINWPFMESFSTFHSFRNWIFILSLSHSSSASSVCNAHSHSCPTSNYIWYRMKARRKNEIVFSWRRTHSYYICVYYDMTIKYKALDEVKMNESRNDTTENRSNAQNKHKKYCRQFARLFLSLFLFIYFFCAPLRFLRFHWVLWSLR